MTLRFLNILVLVTAMIVAAPVWGTETMTVTTKDSQTPQDVTDFLKTDSDLATLSSSDQSLLNSLSQDKRTELFAKFQKDVTSGEGEDQRFNDLLKAYA